MAYQSVRIEILMFSKHQLQLILLIIVAVAPVLPSAFYTKDLQNKKLPLFVFVFKNEGLRSCSCFCRGTDNPNLVKKHKHLLFCSLPL